MSNRFYVKGRFWSEMLLVVGAIAIIRVPASAQKPDFFCFMQDGTGRISDLSMNVCGVKPNSPPSKPPTEKAPQKTSNVPKDADAAFWQTFTTLINDPQTRQTAELIGPGEAMNLAKGVCQTLEAGDPLPDPKTQESKSRYPATYFDAVNQAAVTTYCPKYKSKLKV
jgi:hypothetical protein